MATMIDAPPDPPTADGAVAAAKAYLRLETAEEDTLIGALIAVALDLCERFTGVVPIAGDRTSMLDTACGGWVRLPAAPVRSIGSVSVVAADGGATPLAADGYAARIDAAGDGWIQVRDGAGACVRVAYRAGLAGDWSTLPAALGQGVVRLVAHLHAHRDAADEAGPPAAVTALWRPFRRLRLTGAAA